MKKISWETLLAGMAFTVAVFVAAMHIFKCKKNGKCSGCNCDCDCDCDCGCTACKECANGKD